MSTKGPNNSKIVAPNVMKPKIHIDCWALVVAKYTDPITGIVEAQIRNCQNYARRDMLTCCKHDALELEARALKRSLEKKRVRKPRKPKVQLQQNVLKFPSSVA